MAVKEINPPLKDRIGIDEMALSCCVGCTPDERANPQTITLSLILETPLERAGLSDRLEDSVDYAQVMANIYRNLEGKTFHLLETIAQLTADLVLKDKSISAVKVKVIKTTLPQVKSVFVEIHREK